jgi:hypothetical protein
VSRLNEALLVSYSAMHDSVAGTNFEAVDRVVRIVRELDRYHGFARYASPQPAPEPLRLAAPSRPRSRSKARSGATLKWRRKPLKSLKTDSEMAIRRLDDPPRLPVSEIATNTLQSKVAIGRRGGVLHSSQERTAARRKAKSA